MLDKKERSPDMWKQLALNEAAMAVVAANFPDLNNIEFVSSLILFILLTTVDFSFCPIDLGPFGHKKCP